MARSCCAGILGLLIVFAPQSSHAQSQLARTFVSSVNGNDANDCNRATPCRTFQRAHDNTLPSGEITVLDAGGYGAVNITKNISIINDGVGEAGILVSGGNTGVAIHAGPGDAVTLRGLTIKGIGFGGGNGIVFTTGKILGVENCTVRNMDGGAIAGKGIAFTPTTANAKLSVSNTVVSDNLRNGIVIQPVVSQPNTASSAVLTRVEVRNNGGDGVIVDGESSGANSVEATISDSVAAFNGGTGIRAFTQNSTAPVLVKVVRSLLARNGVGVGSDGGGLALLYLMGNTFLEGVELNNPDNNIRSFGDNDLFASPPLVNKH
jgi:hypothetical protein